jgi:ABC-2 type transport system ATP-binding protein/lipopolysaccharide transport system ATP-binding protein
VRDEVWSLRDVDLDVAEGEAVGLLGRNGAGKSTMLKVLTRITDPTSGTVRTRGRVGALLEVGTGFHPELTGRENVYLNGAVLGMARSEIDRQYDAIVDFSGVERFLDTPVKRYSSGMYLRLAFAVAAHLQADIMVVDEVLAVGDAEFQRKCLGKMADIERAGRTVVFVSHNLDAIQRLCPRSVWLEQGRVALSGPTPEVLDAYLSSGQAAVARSTFPDGAPEDGVWLRR